MLSAREHATLSILIPVVCACSRLQLTENCMKSTKKKTHTSQELKAATARLVKPKNLRYIRYTWKKSAQMRDLMITHAEDG